MTQHFNKLTPAELERLAILGEELNEAGQVIGKILRHGYDCHNPDPVTDGNKITISYTTNRELLEIELGDILYAIDAMVGFADINKRAINKRKKAKIKKIKPYLHHQSVETTDTLTT